jgi:transposase
MQAAPQPLLACLSMLPEESLFSFLVRLSQANSYISPSIMWDLVLGKLDPRKHHRYVKDRLDFPFKTETYSRIATFTMTDPLMLYKSTYHRFVLVLTPPPRSLNYLALPDKSLVPCLSSGQEQPYMRPLSISSQFCPKCLEENPYYPLNWAPVALSACLKHECLLVDQCPNCYKKVSQYAVVMAKCDKCKSDLTKAEVISIASDEIGLRTQRILQSWFMEYVTPEHEISNLPLQSPAVLYKIIEGIQNSIQMRKHQSWSYFHYLPSYPDEHASTFRKGEQVLTPYENYCMYATACKAIMNWPESFFDFLHRYTDEKDHNPQNIFPGEANKEELFKGKPQDHLGILYSRWVKQQWSYPEFKFVQEALDYYIAKNYWLDKFSIRTNFYKRRPDLLEYAKYVSVENAAIILNTSTQVIKLLQRNKILSQIIDGGYELVDKREVLYYRKEWDSLVSLEKAGLLMGMPYRVVGELVTLGFLTKEKGSMRDPGRYYKTSEVMTFLEKFSRYVKSLPSQELAEKGPWVDFAKGDYIFTYKESLQAVTLLLQTMEGNLIAYHPSEYKFQLKSLLFAPHNFQECMAFLRDRSLWLEHQEMLKLLGIKDPTLAQWIKNGRILPTVMYKLDNYFDTASIHEFCSEYITQKEAAHILKVSISTLQNWIRANHMSELLIGDPDVEGETARIFDKEQLVQWRKEHLTSNEAAQILEVAKATLYRWVKEGKLRPLDTISDNQYWFLKQAVIDLKH